MPSVEVNPVKQLETVVLHPKSRSTELLNLQLKEVPLPVRVAVLARLEERCVVLVTVVQNGHKTYNLLTNYF